MRASVRLEESTKPILTGGKLAYGAFRVENGWPLVRYWRSGNELEDCGTLVHELVHYWHWVLRGRPAWNTFVEATQQLEHDTDVFEKVTEIVLKLAEK